MPTYFYFYFDFYGDSYLYGEGDPGENPKQGFGKRKAGGRMNNVMHEQGNPACIAPSHVKQLRACGHREDATRRNCRWCEALASAAYRRRQKLRAEASDRAALAEIAHRALRGRANTA